jgi:hypothetical protein
MAHDPYTVFSTLRLADGDAATLCLAPVGVRLERQGNLLLVTLTRYGDSLTAPRMHLVERFVLADTDAP